MSTFSRSSGLTLIPRRDLLGNPDRVSPQLSPDGKRLSFLAPVNGVLNACVGSRGPLSTTASCYLNYQPAGVSICNARAMICVRLRRRHSLGMRRDRGYVIRLIPKETSLKTRPLEAEGLFYAPRGSAASHWPPGRASLMGLL